MRFSGPGEPRSQHDHRCERHALERRQPRPDLEDQPCRPRGAGNAIAKMPMLRAYSSDQRRPTSASNNPVYVLVRYVVDTCPEATHGGALHAMATAASASSNAWVVRPGRFVG